MSNISDLIKEYCPNGVPYKSLGELGSFYGGLTGKSKKDFESGNARYISYMNIYTNMAVDLTAEDYVQISPGEHQNRVALGDVFFTGSSETKEECAISSVLTEEPDADLYLNSFCFGLRFYDKDLFLPSFLKHLLRSGKVRKALQKTASGVTRFNVSKDKMAKVKIPVPPLIIQEQIAAMLDEYDRVATELIRTLDVELANRRIQFEYYRTQLFEERIIGVKPCRIKDVCIKTCSGGTPKTSNTSYYGGDIPWLRTQEVDWKDIYDTEIKITKEGLANSSAKLIPENCVIVAMYGATAAKSAINKIPLATNQACCNLQINPEKARYTYVYYWLCMEYLKLKSLGRGSQDNLNADMIKNYPIIVPPLPVQDEIIALLDQYVTMESTYEELLKKESILRQVQYEYYRDRSFIFKEKSN